MLPIVLLQDCVLQDCVMISMLVALQFLPPLAGAGSEQFLDCA